VTTKWYKVHFLYIMFPTISSPGVELTNNIMNRTSRYLASAFINILAPREDWMIYRGSGLLGVVWFGSTPSNPFPPPLRSAGCLSFSVFLCVAGPACLQEREGGGGRGAESYECKKAWASRNSSILSACHCNTVVPQDCRPLENKHWQTKAE